MKKRAFCLLAALLLLSCRGLSPAEEAEQLQSESALQFCAWIETEEQYQVLSVSSGETSEEVRVQISDAESGRSFITIVSFGKDTRSVDFIIPDLCFAPDSAEGYKMANDANTAAVYAVYLLNGTGTLWAVARQMYLSQELLQLAFRLFAHDVIQVYGVVSGQ